MQILALCNKFAFGAPRLPDLHMVRLWIEFANHRCSGELHEALSTSNQVKKIMRPPTPPIITTLTSTAFCVAILVFMSPATGSDEIEKLEAKIQALEQ